MIPRQLNGLGRACEVVDDGVAAIEKLRGSQYAMLLTDCDMPNMDGYELARQIRSEEGELIHLPIVAITANAIDGAAQDCLEAGMDDYIAKTVQMSEVHRVPEVFMPRKETLVLLPDVEQAAELATEQASQQSNESVPDRVLDTSSLSAIFGDDEQTIKELLEEFIVSSEETMTDLNAAVDQESVDQVRSSADKLKSAARAVGAHVLADLCEALEAAGKEKDWIK
ncbi:MAG: response regulator [Pseudomonadales bacterium]|nr:response regulator [Pseudomonadales bacterium]